MVDLGHATPLQTLLDVEEISDEKLKFTSRHRLCK